MPAARFSFLSGLILTFGLLCGWGMADDVPSAARQAVSHVSTEASAETLKAAGRQLAAVAAEVTPAVVHIESTHDGRNGSRLEETGSGVLVTSTHADGLFVVTNRHVVADAKLNDIQILLMDGRVIFPTEKREDPDSDIAVLRVDDMGITPVQFGDSDSLDIGHFVLAMGSPFGLSNSVTLGIISAKGRRSLELPGRRVVNQDFLQTDAAINPGNSGGPLIDLNGRVVGINTAIASQSGGNEGIGFSIPSNLVKFVVTQLLENGRVKRGYLGVELDNRFDIEAAKRYALDRKRGARVVRVIDDTPAALAGIRPDDIILNFDGLDIQDENDLINKVSLTPVNKQVRVIVLRDGNEKTLRITLTERPEQRTSHVAPPRPPVERVERKVQNVGLSTFQLNRSLAVQLGFDPAQAGLLVKSVSGPADEDRLQIYDVIEEVARRPVQTAEELDAVLEEFAGERTLLVKVRRRVDGETQTRLVLWERP
jgi:serine protease Do